MVTTTYTLRGLARQMSGSGGTPYVAEATYNAQANPLSRVTGNDLTAYYDYFTKNGNYRLKQLKMQRPDHANLLDMVYQYDLAGNITHITDTVQSQVVVQKFTYDALNRLTRAEPVGTQFPDLSYTKVYKYNAIGNMTERNGQTQ